MRNEIDVCCIKIRAKQYVDAITAPPAPKAQQGVVIDLTSLFFSSFLCFSSSQFLLIRQRMYRFGFALQATKEE